MFPFLLLHGEFRSSFITLHANKQDYFQISAAYKLIVAAKKNYLCYKLT